MKTYYLNWTDMENCKMTSFKIDENQKRLIEALIETADLRHELAIREIDIRITEDTIIPIDLT